LAALLVGRALTSALGEAEVAAAVGVELAEAAVLFQHVEQRGHRRCRALLREEAREEDAAVGVVEHDDEVLRRHSCDPLVRRCIEVQHHPRQRPPLPLAQVATSPLALVGEAVELQQVAHEGVRNGQAVPLGHVLVKVPDREVDVPLSAQAQQLAHHLVRDPPPSGQASPSIAKTLLAEALRHEPQPPHVPRRHAEDHRRIDPTDDPLQGFANHFHPRHRLGLVGHLHLACAHAPAVQGAEKADITNCSWGGHLSRSLHAQRPELTPSRVRVTSLRRAGPQAVSARENPGH
jgi:hypothetical protein